VSIRIFLSYYLEPLAYLLFAAAFLFNSRHEVGTRRFKSLFIYYLIGFLLFAFAAFKSRSPESNTHLYNLLYPLTSLFLANYLFSILQSRLKKTLCVVAGLVTLLYYLLNIDEKYFDSVGYAIASIGIVILIFLYMHQILTHVNEDPLSQNFDFWFICIQLTYHLSSFAIFLSYNYFTYRYFENTERREFRTILTYLWVVHNVLLLLGSIAVIVGLVWIYRKRSPSS
jgi:hypothetical protein